LGDTAKGVLGTFKGINNFLDSNLHSIGKLAFSGQYDSQKESLAYRRKLIEEETKEKNFVDVMSDKSVQAAMQSPKIKKMQQDAAKVLSSGLDDVYTHAKAAITKATNIDQLNKMSGGKLSPALEKAKKEIEQQRPQDKQQSQDQKNQTMSPNDTKHAEADVEKTLAESSKQTIKDFYVDAATKQLSAEIESGLPENHPYVNLSKKNIERLKAL
jgi:hypothetical protein